MASIDNPHPELPAGEDLVAYLDGELPPDDCRRVEERLAIDPVFRQQLHELDKAWDALDALPQPTAGDEFARTTIEMLAVACQEDISKQTSTAEIGERKRRLCWTVLGGVAIVAGFAGARFFWPDSNRTLLADLPVIEQYDLLTQIGDIDFLRKLSTAVPLEQLTDDAAARDRKLEQIVATGKLTPEERPAWIEKLPPVDKAELSSQFKRYENLPESSGERERLKKLEQQISSAPDAEKLRQTMIAYGQWLGDKSSEQDKLLHAKSTDDRLALVQSLVRRDDRRVASQLSAEDSQKLRAEILAVANERKADFLKELRDRNIQISTSRLEEHPNAVALLIVMRELWKRDSGEATRLRLVNQLSPAAKEQLEGSGRQRGGFWQLRQWMVSSLEPRRDPGAVAEFFAKSTQLSDEDRARLFAMPTAEMEVELERRYFGEQLGVGNNELQRVFEDLGRGGPPGGFGRPEFGPDRRRPFGRPGGPDDPGPGPGGPPPRDMEGPNRFDRDRPERGLEGRRPGGPRRGPGGRDGPPPDERRPPPPDDGHPPPPPDERGEPI